MPVNASAKPTTLVTLGTEAAQGASPGPTAVSGSVVVTRPAIAASPGQSASGQHRPSVVAPLPSVPGKGLPAGSPRTSLATTHAVDAHRLTSAGSGAVRTTSQRL